MRGLELMFAPAERRASPLRKPAPVPGSTERMSSTERAAEAALRRGDWLTARNLFSEAADAIPIDPHKGVSADAIMLVRRSIVAHTMHQRLRGFGLERTFVKAA